MSVTYRFSEVRMTDKAHVTCPDCGKKRLVTVVRSYYRNGFHNEEETRAKYRVQIQEEVARLHSVGSRCKSCTDAQAGKPVLTKVTKDEYTAHDRQGNLLGRIVRRRDYGWVKWQTPDIKDQYHGTLEDAAEALMKAVPHDPASPKGDNDE